ncbi:protein of unknown function [Cupriavidus taiwanensis]|nr:hypothetical protein CBM2606_A90429 [Cupriavidus taiwanensis]SPA41900.1 protein of unknown function [Cupriavidus taiwanensis]
MIVLAKLSIVDGPTLLLALATVALLVKFKKLPEPVITAAALKGLVVYPMLQPLASNHATWLQTLSLTSCSAPVHPQLLPFAQHTEGLRDATGNRFPCLESVATMVALNARRSRRMSA